MSTAVRTRPTVRADGALGRLAAGVRRAAVLAVLVAAVGLAALDAFDREYGSESTFGRCVPRCLDLVPAGDDALPALGR